MRPIDADAIKLSKGFFEKVDNVPKFYDWLDEQPTIDAVPVVRCKACANWDRETHGCLRNPSVSPWWEDDFCNYGARRDTEADYEWSEEEQFYIEQGYMDTQVGLPDLYMN